MALGALGLAPLTAQLEALLALITPEDMDVLELQEDGRGSKGWWNNSVREGG